MEEHQHYCAHPIPICGGEAGVTVEPVSPPDI